MRALEHRLPPPLVALLLGAGMWALARAWPAMAWPQTTPLIVCVGVVVIGLLVALSGVYQFAKARTTVNPLDPDQVSAMVTGGIYRYTRNPMYLGMLVVLIGWALFLSHHLVWIALPAFILFIHRFQIQPEERVLRARFGRAFEDYCRAVRRWI